MKDVAFVQFYTENADNLIFLQNGLSYVWNNIKDNHFWIKSGGLLTPKCPISKGRIYASSWFRRDEDVLLKWKENNPNLEIISGGPLATSPQSNLMVYLKGSAEDVLFEKQVESKFGLEIPSEFENSNIRYCVSLMKECFDEKHRDACYWGKCTFCAKSSYGFKIRRNYAIPIVDHPKHKHIWINTRAITPFLLEEIYSKLEDRSDVTYITYCRADALITRSLKNVIKCLKVDPKFIEFKVGIEFPSNHMLKVMNKGITKEEYLEFVKIANENNINLDFSFILNWPEVTDEDVKEVYSWLNDLSKINYNINITGTLFPLTIYSDSELKTLYKDLPKANEKDIFRRRLFAKNLHFHYQQNIEYYTYLVLNDNVRKLNNAVWNMYRQFPFKHFDDSSYSKLQYQYGM